MNIFSRILKVLGGHSASDAGAVSGLTADNARLQTQAAELMASTAAQRKQILALQNKMHTEAPINFNFRKLQVLITSRCNFTCVMCTIIHQDKGMLSEEQVRSIIEDADELGFDEVEISGGEPYYLSYFKSVINDYAGAVRPKIKVCTNAYPWTAK